MDGESTIRRVEALDRNVLFLASASGGGDQINELKLKA